jgi:hypothetical protein
MRISSIAIIGIAVASVMPFALRAQQTNLLDAAQAQKMVTDSAAAQQMIQAGTADDLAWEWFIALNMPLTGSAPKLWESWRQTSSVYLPDGQKPPPWGQTPAPPAAVITQARQQGLNTNLPFHNLDSEVQVDGLALRDKLTPAQNVRYQLLMNPDTFQYVYDNGLYNVNGQAALAQNGKPANFPSTSFELKTSWIWIGSNEVYDQLKDKFYIVNAYYALVDGSGKPNGLYRVGRAALSGMHIISKPVPQWLWTTFQNVNDAQYTEANNKLPMSNATKAANDKYRAALKKTGSIFANYQLMGAQWQFADPAGKPILLANSQIESAFQPSSSCITCHSTASYSVSNGYFNLVKQQSGGITYYTGNPPVDQLKGYNSLDFVWSLKRAQWLRAQP